MTRKKLSQAQIEEAQRFYGKAVHRLDDHLLDCLDSSSRHGWRIYKDFYVYEHRHLVGRPTMVIAREWVCRRQKCSRWKRERFIITRNQRLERIPGAEYAWLHDPLVPGVPRGVPTQTVVLQERYRRAMERAAKAERGQREAAER